MTLRRCARGHHFDDDRGQACPSCALLDIVPAAGTGTTDRAPASLLAIEPVVGWLVCTAGPDRGRDFRLRGVRTAIGRGLQMGVSLLGDAAVSRDTHAIVRFDAATEGFTVLPGSAGRTVRVNGAAIAAPTTLTAGDVIAVGRTHLLFVPLCGAGFRWDAVDGD